jgi:hypothetical protein
MASGLLKAQARALRISPRCRKALRGGWEEIPGAAGRREIRGGGTLCGRRWWLPGDTLVKLEAWVRLGDEVPVGHLKFDT